MRSDRKGMNNDASAGLEEGFGCAEVMVRLASASPAGEARWREWMPAARRSGVAALGLLAVIAGLTDAACMAITGNVDLPRYPSISPDGSQIVFSWRGDLWKMSATGGPAIRLTTHPGDDLNSAWTPDGKRIAFESNRNGFQNIYLMNADGTDIRQVTDVDVSCGLVAVGADPEGREVITFDASLEGDVYRSPRPYMISTDGGDIRRIHNAFGDHSIANRNGSSVLFTRGGSSWTRRGYRGPDNRDVWLYRPAYDSFKRLTEWAGNDGQAFWINDQELVYLSDREFNTVNLYRMDAAEGEKQVRRLTDFKETDVHSLCVSADGRTAAFVNWDTLYTLSLTSPNAKPTALDVSANEDEADNYQLLDASRRITEAALSPDGKVLAYVAYGEIYVRNLEESAFTARVTDSHAREKNIAWSPDGLRLYFAGDESGTDGLYAATVALSRSEVKEAFDKVMKPKKPEEAKKPEKEEPAKADEPKPDAPPVQPEPPAATPPDVPSQDPPVQPTPAPQAPAPQTPAAPPAAAEPEKKTEETPAEKDEKKEELDPALKPERWHDAIRFHIEPILVTDFEDRAPDPSPDGKRLAFRRGRGDLMILDLESKETRSLVPGWDTGITWRFSPDSRFIAYSQDDRNFNADVWIIPTDGSKPAVNVSKHPDNDYNPRWSADGKILTFVSERVDEEFDVWSVYLDEDLEALTKAELEDYYKKAEEAAKKRKPLSVKKPDKPTETAKDKPGDIPADPTEPAKEPPVTASPGGAAGGAAAATGKPADPAAPAVAPKAEEKPQEESATQAAEPDSKEEEKKEAEKPYEPPFKWEMLDTAYLRLQRITNWRGSEFNNEITPGGERYVFSGNDGEPGLFSVKYDGSDKKKLTTPGEIQGLSLTGDKVIFVAGGRAGAVPPVGGKVDFYDIEARIRIDLQKQASQKFREAARTLGEIFYHPTMKDLDWGAVTQRYLALASQTRTADEFNYVAARFLGELNGSHLGIRAPGPPFPNSEALGRLGADDRRVEAGFEVTAIVPESPAAKGPMALRVGDIITAIDLKPFGPTDSVWTLLRGKAGKEVVLTVLRSKTLIEQEIAAAKQDIAPEPARASEPSQPSAPSAPPDPSAFPEPSRAREEAVPHSSDPSPDPKTTNPPPAEPSGAVETQSADATVGVENPAIPADRVEINLLMTPINSGRLRSLKYEAWRNRNAALVEEWSGGRLGYIHIEAMAQPALDVFERDLYAVAHDKEGLLIDVRNNGGGSTADLVLASIMAQPHAYTVPRGADPNYKHGYPQDRLFIQRYTLPINMLCNEKSFSNAEIISHAFKTLKRGTLVGQETYGAVISTGGTTLIDGTSVRLPFRGWYLLDGTDMENHGARPDLVVDQTPEAESANDDEQLKAAVEDLLKRLE